MSSKRDQSKDLKNALSQTLIALVANGITDAKELRRKALETMALRAMTSPLLRSEREQIADAVLAAAANAEAARGLVLSVRGSSITVGRRETELSLTYEKPPDHPQF